MSHEPESDATPLQPSDCPPRPLSVDQLTQAIAGLLDDNTSAAAHGVAVETAPPDAGPAESCDADDSARVTPEAVLEAILFVGHPLNEPLTGRRMAGYLRGVSPQEIDAMIAELNRRYREQSAPYEIVSQGTGYRMALRAEFLRLRSCFIGRVREAKLTQAAVDLLAIVAYNQPIAGERIDKLRGQSSGGLLAQLVRRRLLQVAYSADKPRLKVYTTTDRFLELFGLTTLADLPSHEDF